MTVAQKLSGVLPVDKPAGITSHDVIDAARDITGEREIGHTGSLDPDATGLLLLCIGNALKIVQFLDVLPKAYESIFQFGVTTNTDDASGVEIERRAVPPLTRDEIERICSEFRGDILQKPPLFSAVKVDGKRAYKLAREGRDFDLPPRPTTVHRLEIVDWQSPSLTVIVDCSKGTYIRSLARDIGERIGCGGIVQTLRRTRVGDFRVEEAVDIKKASVESIRGALVKIDRAVEFMETVQTGEDNGKKFRNGLAIVIPKEMNGLVRVYSESNFIGIGSAEGHLVRPKRVFETL